MVINFIPASAAMAQAMRETLLACGAAGVRVRRMRNGALRLVLRDANQRDAVRDALVLSDARTARGTTFTTPDSRFAWNGTTEIFVRFVA